MYINYYKHISSNIIKCIRYYELGVHLIPIVITLAPRKNDQFQWKNNFTAVIYRVISSDILCNIYNTHDYYNDNDDEYSKHNNDSDNVYEKDYIYTWYNIFIFSPTSPFTAKL